MPTPGPSAPDTTPVAPIHRTAPDTCPSPCTRTAARVAPAPARRDSGTNQTNPPRFQLGAAPHACRAPVRHRPAPHPRDPWFYACAGCGPFPLHPNPPARPPGNQRRIGRRKEFPRDSPIPPTRRKRRIHSSPIEPRAHLRIIHTPRFHIRQRIRHPPPDRSPQVPHGRQEQRLPLTLVLRTNQQIDRPLGRYRLPHATQLDLRAHRDATGVESGNNSENVIATTRCVRLRQPPVGR